MWCWLLCSIRIFFHIQYMYMNVFWVVDGKAEQNRAEQNNIWVKNDVWMEIQKKIYIYLCMIGEQSCNIYLVFIRNSWQNCVIIGIILFFSCVIFDTTYKLYEYTICIFNRGILWARYFVHNLYILILFHSHFIECCVWWNHFWWIFSFHILLLVCYFWSVFV